MVDPEGAERAQRVAYEKRGLTLSVVGDHGYLDGVLDLESTELLRAALEPLMATAGTVRPALPAATCRRVARPGPAQSRYRAAA